MDFMDIVVDQKPIISVITEIEALSWVNPDKEKEEVVANFVADAQVMQISTAIVKRCVAIRRSRKIKTPDAIIAATAIAHDFTLLTDDGDFKNIPGLKVIYLNSIGSE